MGGSGFDRHLLSFSLEEEARVNEESEAKREEWRKRGHKEEIPEI